MSRSLDQTLWTTAWTHGSNELSQLSWNEFLFYMKGNHSMSLPQQERKHAEFFSVTHCLCVLTPSSTSDCSITRCQNSEKECLCVCVWKFLYVSGVRHYGCDTKFIQSSHHGKESGINWCSWLKVRQLAVALALSILHCALLLRLWGEKAHLAGAYCSCQNYKGGKVKDHVSILRVIDICVVYGFPGL